MIERALSDPVAVSAGLALLLTASVIVSFFSGRSGSAISLGSEEFRLDGQRFVIGLSIQVDESGAWWMKRGDRLVACSDDPLEPVDQVVLRAQMDVLRETYLEPVH